MIGIALILILLPQSKRSFRLSFVSFGCLHIVWFCLDMGSIVLFLKIFISVNTIVNFVVPKDVILIFFAVLIW